MPVERACDLGLTVDELQARLGGQYDAFMRWMRGQTMSICDGRRYDHEARRYFPTRCAPGGHGVVVYSHDVERFERGLPVID